LITTDMPPGTACDESSTAALELFFFAHACTSVCLATVASTSPVSIANRPAPDVRR